MFLKYKDSEEEVCSFNYINEENSFELKNADDKVIYEIFPILKLDPEYNPLNYECVFLHNEREEYSENSIYQVYVESQRIGWIFPLQALLSTQHDYANNIFFLKYAYVAYYILINEINSKNEKVSKDNILLEDFYDDSLTLLILDKENISLLTESFDINHYIVSLYKKGYSWYGKGNLESNIDKPNKIIRLKPISKELFDKKYIYTMFKNEIPKTQEAFARFHIYYQIIEILISVVFEDKFKKFRENIDSSVESLFDQRDMLSNMIVEKQRVKWLFSEYVSILQINRNRLNDECKRLLDQNKKKTYDEVAENLYTVRCLLVHSMYILDDHSHEILEDVNKAFIDVIMDILLSFKVR